MMDINFYVKSMRSFTILSVVWYERLTQILPIAHRLVRVQGIEEDTPSNMFSFINFEPLELYWTYFLALQTTTPKIPQMRLMSLDHELKMRCCGISSNYGPWWDYITMSFGPWASASFSWIWTLLGFKIDSPKIHGNVDVVWVTNEMRPRGVKNLSSTDIKAQSCLKAKAWLYKFSSGLLYLILLGVQTQ